MIASSTQVRLHLLNFRADNPDNWEVTEFLPDQVSNRRLSTIGLQLKTLARRRRIQTDPNCSKKKQDRYACWVFVYLQPSLYFLGKRSRVRISLTTKTRHGSYAHVHTIIHNYCKFNVDHWHHHMLRDSRLRSSEQFGTRQ